jgi:general secretion pathway protein B
MSYILDALRRADAERTRGAVPGLHAQNAPADAEPAARNFSPLIWGAGAAGVLLVAVVVVIVFGPWRAQPDAKVAAGPLAPAPELAPPRDGAVPAATGPAPVPGELAPARPGALDPGSRPIEPPPGRERAYPPDAGQPPPQRLPAREAAPARVATLEPRAAAPSQPAVEHYGPPVAPSAPLAKPAAIPGINDLPADVRAQLPRLAVGGAIYSETPSARMVILNGQVFHEGDKPAADTVLEQIRLKSAVFNFRGQRYEVAF